MGLAIIIPNLDFSSNNLGQVTFDMNVPIKGLSISAGSRTDNDIQIEATYLPANTTQTGITWSIQSGSSYASINSSTGVLTVLQGASSNSVVVKATSTANNSITATCTLSVTYQKVVKRIQYIATNGYNYVDTGIAPEANSGYKAQVTLKTRGVFTGNTAIMGETRYRVSSSSFAGNYDWGTVLNYGNDYRTIAACNGDALATRVNNSNVDSIITIKVGDFGFEATINGETIDSKDWSSRDYTALYSKPHDNFYLCNINVKTQSDSYTTPLGAQDNADLVNIYDFVMYKESAEYLHLHPALVDGVPMFVDDNNNEFPIHGTSNIIYLENEGGTEVTYTPE